MTQLISTTSCCSKITFTNASPCEKFLEDLFFMPLLNGKEYTHSPKFNTLSEKLVGQGEAKPFFLRDVCKIVCFVALFFISIPLLCIRNHNRKNLIVSRDPQSTTHMPNSPAAISFNRTPAVSLQNTFKYLQKEIIDAEDPQLQKNFQANYAKAKSLKNIHEVIPNLYISEVFEDGYSDGIVHLDGRAESTKKHQEFNTIIRLTSKTDAFRFTKASYSEFFLNDQIFSTEVREADFTPANVKESLLTSIRALYAGRTVFINGSKTRNRSPAFAALLCALVYDTTIEQSYFFIRSKRVIAPSFSKPYVKTITNLLPELKKDEVLQETIKFLRDQMS